MSANRTITNLAVGQDRSSEGWHNMLSEMERSSDRASSYSPTSPVLYTTACIKGVPVEIFAPTVPAKGRVLYVHGGAYVQGITDFYRRVAECIAHRTGSVVYMPDYAVCQPYPASLNDVAVIWKYLDEYGDLPIALAGDSAGAHIATCLVFRLKEGLGTMPSLLALVSPWLDMTASGESVYDNYYLDVVMGRRDLSGRDIPNAIRQSGVYDFLGDISPNDPAVSPLFAPKKRLCPTWIAVGGHEILLSDSARFAKSCQKEGIPVSIHIGEGMYHNYPLHFDKHKEGDMAMQAMCDAIVKSFS